MRFSHSLSNGTCMDINEVPYTLWGAVAGYFKVPCYGSGSMNSNLAVDLC